MTKDRAPLTLERALIRIADRIGFDAMAHALSNPVKSVATRTVRNWSDPDTPERCPLEAAPVLDLAFQKAGGEGAPLFEWFERTLELARSNAFAGQFSLSRLLTSVIKEGSEAEIALLKASMPGATQAEKNNAAREIEEAIGAFQKSLAAVASPRP